MVGEVGVQGFLRPGRGLVQTGNERVHASVHLVHGEHQTVQRAHHVILKGERWGVYVPRRDAGSDGNHDVCDARVFFCKKTCRSARKSEK